jgi:AcrR family transcriptional regulator
MTGEGQQTLRQRRAAATALNIETHAVALALEHGLENVTVEMICGASNVSPRTFFNYFGTKDNVILGHFVPEIDEQKAREFIASQSPDILGEVIGVVKIPDHLVEHKELEFNRMKLLSANPSLMAKQQERFATVPKKIEEILFLRLRRDAPSHETEEQTRDVATMAAELIALAFRYTLTETIRNGPRLGNVPLPADAVVLLKSVMARLSA